MDISKNHAVDVLVDKAMEIASYEDHWTPFERYQALMLAALVKQGRDA